MYACNVKVGKERVVAESGWAKDRALPNKVLDGALHVSTVTACGARDGAVLEHGLLVGCPDGVIHC